MSDLTVIPDSAAAGAFPQDTFDYATIAAYQAAGWTVGGSGTVSVETTDTDGQAAVLKATVVNDGEAYISRSFTTVMGRTYTATIRAKNYADNTFDTGSGLRWDGGFNDAVNTDEWDDLSVPILADSTSETIQIGRFGGFFGLPGTFFGKFHSVEVSDGTTGGTSQAEFSDVGSCVGSGIGETGGGA